MRKHKFVVLTALFILPLLFAACNKEDNTNPNQTDLSTEVSGTYKGTITSSEEPNDSRTAQLTVTSVNSNTAQFDLVSPLMDTSFMMNLYDNNDSVMVCFTENMFYQQYGHHLDEEHHMMGDNDHMEWGHHMDEQHEPGDEHYGGFDTNNHSFSYRIIPQGQTEKYYTFDGNIE